MKETGSKQVNKLLQIIIISVKSGKHVAVTRIKAMEWRNLRQIR